MRLLDVRDKVRELGVSHPEWSVFRRIGDLTKLRHDAARGFHPVNYESGLLLYALVARHRPACVLEIGTGRGFASLCMAQAMIDVGMPGRIVTVDWLDYEEPQEWAIDEGDGPRVARLSRKDVWERHFPVAVRERIEQRRGASMAVLPQLEREGFRADLLYVDGDHTYTGAAHDFYAAVRVTARPFRMLLDDYTPLSHLYGVRRLVDDEIAPVFEAEQIATEGRWSASAETPVIDQAQVLIDSERVRRPIEDAYASRLIAARLFAYRRFKRVFAWRDQLREG